MENLRECPFCGNEMKKFHWPDHNRPWRSFDYWTCTKIGCTLGELKIQVGDIDTFNTRSSDATIKELVEALDKACRSINDLIESSEGVAGLHLNGDVASWGSLRVGGRFESWLIEFDEACDVLAKHKPKD